MIVIRYCGGLGNQMFQYAMQYSLTRKYPSQVIKGENFHYNIDFSFSTCYNLFRKKSQ